MVINTKCEVKNLDHDFAVGPKHYFHCSVYKTVDNSSKWKQNINPNDTNMLINIGPAFTFIRSGYHSRSTSSTHLFDVCNLFWNRLHIESIYQAFDLNGKLSLFDA